MIYPMLRGGGPPSPIQNDFGTQPTADPVKVMPPIGGPTGIMSLPSKIPMPIIGPSGIMTSNTPPAPTPVQQNILPQVGTGGPLLTPTGPANPLEDLGNTAIVPKPAPVDPRFLGPPIRRGGTDTIPAMLTRHEGVLNTGAMAMPGMRNFVARANANGMGQMPPLPLDLTQPQRVPGYARGTADVEAPVWDQGGFVANPMPTPIPYPVGIGPQPTPTPSPTPTPNATPQGNPTVEVPTDQFAGAIASGSAYVDPFSGAVIDASTGQVLSKPGPFAGARAGGSAGSRRLGSGAAAGGGGIPSQIFINGGAGFFRGGTWIPTGGVSGRGFGAMGFSQTGVPGTWIPASSTLGTGYSTAIGQFGLAGMNAAGGGSMPVGFTGPESFMSKPTAVGEGEGGSKKRMAVETYLDSLPRPVQTPDQPQYISDWKWQKDPGSAMSRGTLRGWWSPIRTVGTGTDVAMPTVRGGLARRRI